MIYEASIQETALRQGEIISNLVQRFGNADSIIAGEQTTFKELSHPLAIIVSQDCDLDLEYKARNNIPNENGNVQELRVQITNILFCEVFPFGEIRGRYPVVNTDTVKRIRQN